jgi:osmotically-inducible protein OsmY
MQAVKWIGVGLVCAVFGLGCNRGSQTISEPSGAAGTNVDNTAINKRDRDNATLTADDQSKSESDREMTRQIRRAIVKSDQLSMTAKNIKIITIDGKVTLRGPVKTDEERKLIDQIAQGQGAGSVDNQLEVKARPQ